MEYGSGFFFFFQAEDGIRDLTVTGVQTCALPISILGDVHEGRPAPGRPGVSSGVAQVSDGELDAGLLQGLSLCFRADEREHVVPRLLQRERDCRTDVPAAAREEDLHARPSRMKRPVYAGRSGPPRANVTCVAIFAPPPPVRGNGWVYGVHAIKRSVENVSGMCPDAPRRLAASRLLPTNPMGNVERLLARRTDKVAVLLNANARNVSDDLKRELENFVPPEDLYYSRCFDDARGIARQVFDKGYRTVLTGGGDGTFVGYVNCLFEEAMQPRHGASRGALRLAPVPAHSVRMPRIGALKL